MLYLTESDVRTLLPMSDCIRIMRSTFEALRDGSAQNQPRRRLILKTGSVLHSLAGAYGEYFGTKFYSTNPKHGAHFLFALYDATTAEPLALMEANHLGQIRTGAASGYATDLMASPQAQVLGVIGSGFQARTQVEAIRAIRPIHEVRVWSRNADKVRSFAADMNTSAAESAEAAVRDADIVVTATNAKEPVIDLSWIRPGTHINAMGSNIASRRELPADLVRQAGIVAVDSLEQAKIEAGDLILADCWANVVELKDVRPEYDARRVTVFKSIGLGVEDVAAGAFVYEQAVQRKLGKPLYS
jgi:ornithine cyclodeaminase/alanine dehydrogenase-like protein (mu-crystallin family)